jgi:uncharacterized protein YndB with AHSA1/START domain
MPSTARKSAAAAKRRPARKRAVAPKKKAVVLKKKAVALKKKAVARKRQATSHKAAGQKRPAPPTVKTAMLIRRPVAEVFEAFVNPDITSNFWFTKGSGRLEVGRQVQWDWDMYGFSVPVTTTAIEPNRRIVVEWSGYGNPTTIEWTFAPHDNGSTFVGITEHGFKGSDDEVVEQAKNSMEGFSLVLAGLKAFLEHNIRLNLVADRFPKGIEA